MKKTEIPKWLLIQEGVTQREWKQQKRALLRRIKALSDDYALGSAYCPNYTEHFAKMRTIINQMVDSHSRKKWGR